MKKYFLTGFISLLPLAVTLLVIAWLFNFFTTPFTGVIEKVLLDYPMGLSLRQHDFFTLVLARLCSLFFLLALILTLGFMGQKFFARFFHSFFSRIPLVGSIYRLSRDVTKALFAQKEKTFKGTVLVPFPHDQALAVGFITNEVPEAFRKHISADVTLFVPTAPHPLSGFVLLTNKTTTIPVDISVEDAFKFLLSCGAMQEPTSPKNNTEN